ncbi:MAG: hypothetical protein WB762_30960 [Candidatus Sulfotelmatobacter sp.]
MAKRPGSAGDPLWYLEFGGALRRWLIITAGGTNGDRNAGFSAATPARLYIPVIMDSVWGYEAINVEAQQGNPSSLLSWMRNLIALRKLFRVFGQGSIEFLDPSNHKILRTFGNMKANRSWASPISPASRSPSTWAGRRWRARHRWKCSGRWNSPRSSVTHIG